MNEGCWSMPVLTVGETMKDPHSQNNPWRAVALVSAIGIDLVVCMVVGFFAGNYMSNLTDQKVWIVVGIMAGFAIGVVSIIYILKQFSEDRDG